MAGTCVSEIMILKLYRGMKFNWINDEFLKPCRTCRGGWRFSRRELKEHKGCVADGAMSLG